MDSSCKHLLSYKVWGWTKICARRDKKEKLALKIVVGSAVHLKPVTRYYSSADLSFLFLIAQISFASQILHDGRCLYALSINIFVRILDAPNLNVIKVDNMVTPK